MSHNTNLVVSFNEKKNDRRDLKLPAITYINICYCLDILQSLKDFD